MGLPTFRSASLRQPHIAALRSRMNEIKASKSKAILRVASIAFFPLLFGLAFMASGMPAGIAIGLVMLCIYSVFVYRYLVLPLVVIDGQNIICLNVLGKRSRTFEIKSTDLVVNKRSLYLRPKKGNDFIIESWWFTKADWLSIQLALKSLGFREVI